MCKGPVFNTLIAAIKGSPAHREMKEGVTDLLKVGAQALTLMWIME